VNAYGRSKLAAEQLLLERYTAAPLAILRSSLIYGPQPPVPVGRPLFLQFVDQQLRDKAPTSFFTDEFRWVAQA
jgi:nucleoside-diphosphate-sugar epimerase